MYISAGWRDNIVGTHGWLHFVPLSITWWREERSVINRRFRRCFYLGVHRFTRSLPALHGEFGWSLPHQKHCVNAVWYWNRLLSMDDNRITKIVSFGTWISIIDLDEHPKLNHFLNLWMLFIYITSWKSLQNFSTNMYHIPVILHHEYFL